MVEAFTYEDLYEILRNEKFATDLEEIKKRELARIHAYLESKEKLLKSQKDSTSFLSSKKKGKIQQEIDNALRVLKDIYQIREKKIINRAIYGTRTDSNFKDTTNMLESEVELYEKLLKILRGQCLKFFELIKQEFKNTSEEDKKLNKKKEEEKTSTIEVKFLEKCPEMFGEDMKQYGPFKPEDKAKIPKQLCEILEKKGKIEKIKSAS